jgi:hypothetical protein
VVQEVVAGFLIGQRQNIAYGPDGSGARREVEFYVVFVLIEPGIEQKRFKLHAGTPKKKLISVTDSASRRRDDFLV